MDISYDVTATLRSQDHGHPPVVLIFDARGNGEGRISPTITGDHQNRITDYTAILVEKYKEENNDGPCPLSRLHCPKRRDDGRDDLPDADGESGDRRGAASYSPAHVG